MLSLVKTLKEPSAGCWTRRPGGGRKYDGPPWVCPELTGRPITRHCPTPFRSPTCSTSSGWPTCAWTGCAAACKKKPSDTAEGNTTTSTGYANLLTLAHERLDPRSEQKLTGLLQAGDPHGEVRDAWHAKETVRGIYQTSHPGEGDQYNRLLSAELQNQSCSPELNQLGRTLRTWHSQIVAWHHAQVSNGPTESANNLIKRVKRVVFGFRNYRTRILLYPGKPNPNLHHTLTPPPLNPKSP